MKYLILCLCFWRCAGELNIHISEFIKPWDKLADVGQHLLDYNYIKQNGWRPILHQITDDEEFWIAAKANATLTPLVSWEGCARWLRNPNCTKEIKLGGSIADCIEHCSSTSQYRGYILLQDEQCRCVDKNKAETCFERTNTNLCKTMCLNNTNDRCGGTDMFVSVYLRDQLPYEINKENIFTQNCLYVSSTTAKLKSCYERSTRMYICNGSLVDHGDFLSWSQAFDECGKRHAQLGFEQPDDAPFRKSYWTSLRRSFRIDWISHKDNTNQPCVTVKNDGVHQLILQMDDCKQPHRYLYMSQDRASTSGKPVYDNVESEDCGAYDLGDRVGGVVGSLLVGVLLGIGIVFLLVRYRICNINHLNSGAEENLKITFQKRESGEISPREDANEDTQPGELRADDPATGLSPVTYEELSRRNEEKQHYESLNASENTDKVYYNIHD